MCGSFCFPSIFVAETRDENRDELVMQTTTDVSCWLGEDILVVGSFTKLGVSKKSIYFGRSRAHQRLRQVDARQSFTPHFDRWI